MPKWTNRRAALLVLVLLVTAAASGQQPADSKKKVPAMSSDDFDGGLSAKQPAVIPSTGGTPAGGTPAGLTRYTLESCGLSIALPAAPLDFDVSLAGADKHLMGPTQGHVSVGNGYFIIVVHLRAPGQTTFEGQLDQFVQGFSYAPGHSNGKYTVGDKSFTGASFRGSYDFKGVPFEYEAFVQLQGRHGWLVAAPHPRANGAAVEPARKVLASARFDGPPCPE